MSKNVTENQKQATGIGLHVRVGRWLYGLRQFFALFLMLLLLLYAVFQSDSFQRWAVQKTANYLTQELHTPVKIDRLGIDFFSKLVLQGFYVQDLAGDTLLFSKKLKANFDLNPYNILLDNWEIDEITLENATVKLRRNETDSTFNSQFLVDFLSGPQREGGTKKKPINLTINDIYFSQTHFIKDDRLWGQMMDWYFDEGAIHFNKLDLPNNQIDIRSVELSQPNVKIAESNISALAEQFRNRPIAVAKKAIETPKNPPELPFLLQIRRLKIDEGTFAFDNFGKSPVRTLPAERMDYDHLRVHDINIDIQNFKFSDETFTGIVNRISAQENCGFQLTQLSASRVEINPRQTRLEGMKLVTPNSNLGDTLTFKYREYMDWQHEFNDKVLMEGNLKSAKLAISDLMVFAPQLEEQDFFVKNKQQIFELDGLLQGKVNSLRGKNLSIKLGRDLFLKGDFSSRNLAVRNEEMLNLKLDKLTTDVTTLRRLIPDFHPPEGYDRLGKLDFSGRFDGFFADFVAFGDLKTELGRAQLDMRMNLQDGKTKASYSGKLAMIDFDLGRWTANPELGKITFNTEVKEGKGLTLETVSARLNAKVESFSFKKYTYENILLEGKLNKNLFDGNFSIKDEPLDLDFKGTIDFQEALPKFNFLANVRRIDLYKLNLTPQNFAFTGIMDFDLQGNKISNLQGSAQGKKLVLTDRAKNVTYQLDSVFLVANNTQGNKQLKIRSELLNASVSGYQDISNLPSALQNFVQKNYPQIAKKANIQTVSTPIAYSEAFDFDIQLKDLKNITRLLDSKFDTLRGLSAKGFFDSRRDSIYLDMKIAQLKYQNIETDDITLKINGLNNKSKVDLLVHQTVLDRTNKFAPLSVNTIIMGDEVNFSLTSANFTSILDNLNLNGTLTFQDDFFQIKFLSSDLVILHDSWNINPDNYLRLGNRFILTQNLVLQNGLRKATLRTFNENLGVELALENFNTHYIDELWDDDQMNFGGKYNVTIKAENVFDQKNISLVAHSDSFLVNNDNWGILNVEASAKDIKSLVRAKLSVVHKDEKITANGFYVPPGLVYTNSFRTYPEKYYEMDAVLGRFPLRVAEYFIGDGISRTVGKVDADVKLSGEIGKLPNFSGEAMISDAALTINYLQTRYTIDRQVCKINNAMFDATGAIIKDTLGNSATVTGGITHDHLRNFGLNARLKSPKILALNTTKTDNPTYYGRGIGSMDIAFTGTFKQTDIALTAVAGKDTKLFIPINYGQDASSSTFLHFKSKSDTTIIKKSKGSELKGVGLDMKISFTEEAESQLIFDERAGDIIKGKGRGDVQLNIPRGGAMTMYGNYEIETGEYLFTTLGNYINKPFKVKRGGNIRWTGDPLNAQISLNAEYKGLSSPPYNFLSEVIEPLNDAALKAVSQKATTVDLILQLRGRLLQPEIQFDINFPNAPGELRTYLDNKLRVIRQDQNELNRQVFALMILGQFLPSNQAFSTVNTGVAAAVNTASELILSQASIYVSQLISDIFKGKIVSNAGANFKYNRYQTGEITSPDNLTKGQEFQTRFNFNFLDDRLEVEGALQVASSSSTSSSGTFFGNDIIVNWYVTPERTIKIKGYNRTDQVLEGTRNTTGVGISFRRDFDNLEELFKKK